jgi:LytR cell envelope-related transcriptional attenuator
MSEIVDDDGGRSYRVRRQRRSVIVICVVLLGLAGAFYYASSYFRATAPQPGACTTESVAVPLRPSDVSLNVYNATSRKGLAAAASKTAIDRGFKVKAIGNDPKKATIKQTAQVRFGPAGEASAKLVIAHVPGAVGVNDKREGDTVDLVLGNAWKSFGPVPAVVTPTQTLRPCPTITVTQ